MWTQRRLGKDQELFGIIDIPQPNGDIAMAVTLAGLGQAMGEKNYLFSCLRKKLAAAGICTVQYDYRGHGDSIGELGMACLESMVEDTLQVLQEITEEIQPRHVYLIGHALGAVVALKAAAEWPTFDFRLLLISPPLTALPHSDEIFDQAVLDRLHREGSIDAQALVPGYDYYTMSDFDFGQYHYISSLGAHLLYLHGQMISSRLIQQLDELDVKSLYTKARNAAHVIIGEKNEELMRSVKDIRQTAVHVLSGVAHYYQHPAAMDTLISMIENIIKDDLLCNRTS